MKTNVVQTSANRKTGPMAATYRTQDTCPTACPLMKNGCYAEQGFGGGAFRSAERSGSTSLDKLHALRYQIPRHGWVRFNVSGDFLQEDGTPDTEYIDACNELVTRRPDLNVLAYTHAWRDLDPAMFRFTVNASCETAADIVTARAAGWQTVVADPGGEDTMVGSRVAGTMVIRCPQETSGVQCVRCGACAADKRTRPTIAFVAHGSRKKTAAAVITARRSDG